LRIAFDWSALRGVRWHQYLVRFALGGCVTVVAGLVAKEFGPVFGGLFLAFPAIFPAGATLIASRERKKKARAGMDGTLRGRRAAALDAAGSVLGAVGLGAFAALTWWQLPRHSAAGVLSSAAGCWLLLSVGLWWVRKKHGSFCGHSG
jgi:hypothetical protein